MPLSQDYDFSLLKNTPEDLMMIQISGGVFYCRVFGIYSFPDGSETSDIFFFSFSASTSSE